MTTSQINQQVLLRANRRLDQVIDRVVRLFQTRNKHDYGPEYRHALYTYTRYVIAYKRALRRDDIWGNPIDRDYIETMRRQAQHWREIKNRLKQTAILNQSLT